MLYARGKTADGKEATVELRRAGIFIKCSKCGKEIPYDIVAAAMSEQKTYGYIRIFGAEAVCAECCGMPDVQTGNAVLEKRKKALH